MDQQDFLCSHTRGRIIQHDAVILRSVDPVQSLQHLVVPFCHQGNNRTLPHGPGHFLKARRTRPIPGRLYDQHHGQKHDQRPFCNSRYPQFRHVSLSPVNPVLVSFLFQCRHSARSLNLINRLLEHGRSLALP